MGNVFFAQLCFWLSKWLTLPNANILFALIVPFNTLKKKFTIENC
jgi:hypothetical protein